MNEKVNRILEGILLLQDSESDLLNLGFTEQEIKIINVVNNSINILILSL